MIKDFIKNKQKRKDFFETNQFFQWYEEFKLFLDDNTMIIENEEKYQQMIDSIFEANRDKVFYKSYSYYGVIYCSTVFYKFYKNNNITYLATPIESKKNIVY